MKPYNTSKIIVLPIEKKMQCEINRDRHELDSLSITNKHEYLNYVI